MEKVYVVLRITEYEHCGQEIVVIFGNEEDAINYVDNNQYQFTHWNGQEVNVYTYEEWEVK